VVRQRPTVARHTQRTLLVVGEGDCEVAFLNHLRGLYAARGCGVRVTLRNAHGKGPEHVVDFAVRQCRSADYDLRAALLDTDLPWPPRITRDARARRILLIPSDPCLEGLLLHILDRTVPETSNACKRALRAVLDGRPTAAPSYVPLFDRVLLEKHRRSVRSLAWLLDLFEGKHPSKEDIP